MKRALTLFDDVFGKSLFDMGNAPYYYLYNSRQNDLKIDLYETQNTYELEAYVAGFGKDEIHIELKDKSLFIYGEAKNQKKIDGKYLVNELSYNKFSRQILIPQIINANDIEAKYDNGILRISLPKLIDVKKDKKIQIQ